MIASKIWEEFSSQLERLLPNLNDVLVLAATKVVRDHMNPKNGNMQTSDLRDMSMSVHSDEKQIVIKIKLAS